MGFLKVEMGWEHPGDVSAPLREAAEKGELGPQDAVAFTQRAGEPIVPYVSEHLWAWLQRRFGRSIIKVEKTDAIPPDAIWLHRPKV